MTRLRPLSRSILLASLLGSLAACGGQTESLGGTRLAEPQEDAGSGPVPDPGGDAGPAPAPIATHTHLPSGTIAIGGEAGGVTFYPRGATSDGLALGHLDTVSGAGFFPQYMVFDSQGYLYVDGFYADGATPPANTPVTRIDVYAPGSVGETPPVHTIMGPTTRLWSTRAMAIGRDGSLFVANVEGTPQGLGASTVDVFAPGATGDVAPTQVLQSGSVIFPSGLTFDASGNLYLATSEGDTVCEFGLGAAGLTDPLRSFTGPTTTGDASGLARDGSGSLYLADWNNNQVLVFRADGSSAAPLAGDQTLLNEPSDLAIDLDGRVLVPTQTQGVLVFAAGATGNVAPVGILGVGPEVYGYNVAVVP